MTRIIEQYLAFVFLFILLTNSALGQEEKPNALKGTLINLHYGTQLSGGDLTSRFGQSTTVGAGVLYLTKSKWLLGGEYNFIFGGNVKEDVLSNLRTTNGQILGQNNDYAAVGMNERGFFAGLTIGRLIPIFKGDRRHNIKITVTGGFLRHRILLDDQTGAVPQITGEYVKGYDRLTSGIAVSEFVGYQYLSANRLVNFYAGFDFVQGFTKSRRSFDFNTMSIPTESRTDLLNGFKIGWILPLYSQDADTIFY